MLTKYKLGGLLQLHYIKLWRGGNLYSSQNGFMVISGFWPLFQPLKVWGSNVAKSFLDYLFFLLLLIIYKKVVPLYQLLILYIYKLCSLNLTSVYKIKLLPWLLILRLFSNKYLVRGYWNHTKTYNDNVFMFSCDKCIIIFI